MKLVLAFGLVAFFALSGCSKSSGGEDLKKCVDGYKPSVIQFKNAYDRYEQVRTHGGATEGEKLEAAREVIRECVRHFEAFGTDNCTIDAHKVFNKDPKEVYQQCKREQGH